MSLFFVCNQCDCVDQIDLVYISGRLPTVPHAQLCTLCKTGTWHDQFPHALYNPATDHVTNRATGIGLG